MIVVMVQPALLMLELLATRILLLEFQINIVVTACTTTKTQTPVNIFANLDATNNHASLTTTSVTNATTDLPGTPTTPVSQLSSVWKLPVSLSSPSAWFSWLSHAASSTKPENDKPPIFDCSQSYLFKFSIYSSLFYSIYSLLFFYNQYNRKLNLFQKWKEIFFSRLIHR